MYGSPSGLQRIAGDTQEMTDAAQFDGWRILYNIVKVIQKYMKRTV